MKPKVICHIMASVDGHIQVERWTAPSGDMPKTDLMKTYSDIGKTLCTDAWTFGKNTVRDIFHDKTCIFSLKNEPTELPTTDKEKNVVALLTSFNITETLMIWCGSFRTTTFLLVHNSLLTRAKRQSL